VNEPVPVWQLAGPQQILNNLWRVGGGTWNGRTTALSAEPDGNVYLLRVPGANILVDCGTLAGLPAVNANLDRLGAALEKVGELLLTHSHWDHTEAALAVQTESESVRTHLNGVGWAFLEQRDHRLIGYQINPPPHRFEAFCVDHGVDDHETFDLGNTRAAAHHLPGHTPDSTLYTVSLDGITAGFCGDIVFQPRKHQGPLLGQLCTLWLSNLDHYVDSLRRLLDIHLDLLLPGHGSPVVGRERVRSAIQQTLDLAVALARDERVRENLGV
jgi:glyoxylase-like metal-dependent hydrolase (beta-lactamase superfamily II)